MCRITYIGVWASTALSLFSAARALGSKSRGAAPGAPLAAPAPSGLSPLLGRPSRVGAAGDHERWGEREAPGHGVVASRARALWALRRARPCGVHGVPWAPWISSDVTPLDRLTGEICVHTIA
jgi:hypothetical protein